jgi:hypothetical protein
MMRVQVVAVVCIAIAVDMLAASQTTPAAGDRPLLTLSDIVAQTGNEVDAAAVVSSVLRRAFPASDQPRTIVLIGLQISAHWLPDIRGVQFVRLSEEDLKSWPRCSKYWYVSALRRIDRRLTMTLAEGNRCRVSGRDYQFDLDARTFVDEVESGFVSGTADCGCP